MPMHRLTILSKLLKTTQLFVIFFVLVSLSACNDSMEYSQESNKQGHTAPSAATVRANLKVLEERPFSQKDDLDLATKGLIAKEDNLEIAHLQGGTVWQSQDYSFIDNNKPTPNSVNPSLWRQATLNNIHGLFKVTDGIYQLRGYDLANMSIIESKNGWIIVDPLTATETASRALKFAQQHLGKHKIKAIIFTHSHIDHFGGVEGILQNLSETEKKELQIIAPEGFEEEATSENIIAGTAMSRRAMYMYGKRLARNERGHIDSGLGKGPAFGTFGIESPSILIGDGNNKIDIDGLNIHFQNVSGSEAPAEFVFYIPKYKAFCGAELVSRNLHNLYTLRGAKVRDALLWSHYIDKASQTFSDSEIYFASHHWPLWGKENIQEFLHIQRDTYKFIHDQSVRMLNQGFTPNEIAEELTLPNTLNQNFHNQGYYGSLSHNAKAVYQAYMGWFTANPSKLNPLAEEDSAVRYIDMMGGIDIVLEKAKQQFSEADKEGVKDAIKTYRWLAELLNHAVFSDPDNDEAKVLLAKVYDQLGYQAESAPWRDFYLTGAYELRHGAPEEGISPAVMKNVLLKTPVENFFTSMAVRVIPDEAENLDLNIKITFTDLSKSYLLSLKNSVLHHQEVEFDVATDASLNITQALFVDLIVGDAGIKDTIFSDDLTIDGSKLDLISFFSVFDKPQGTFNIVTP
jgi:alkyl sulfatase BDS1-like metallo-beta-lactamase superfamily hydrolase